LQATRVIAWREIPPQPLRAELSEFRRMATEATPSWTRARRLLIAASGVFALACAGRLLGFGDGLLLGATPASALALGAAVLLRGPGAAAAGLGFVLADLAWGFACRSRCSTASPTGSPRCSARR
jgi:hypothetical protein